MKRFFCGERGCPQPENQMPPDDAGDSTALCLTCCQPLHVEEVLDKTPDQLYDEANPAAKTVEGDKGGRVKKAK